MDFGEVCVSATKFFGVVDRDMLVANVHVWRLPAERSGVLNRRQELGYSWAVGLRGRPKRAAEAGYKNVILSVVEESTSAWQ